MLFFKTTVWVSLSWVDIIHALLICTHVSHLKGATDTPLWVYLTSNLHKSIHKCILYNKSFNFIRGPYKKHRYHDLSNYVIMALIRICMFCMSFEKYTFCCWLVQIQTRKQLILYKAAIFLAIRQSSSYKICSLQVLINNKSFAMLKRQPGMILKK